MVGTPASSSSAGLSDRAARSGRELAQVDGGQQPERQATAMATAEVKSGARDQRPGCRSACRRTAASTAVSIRNSHERHLAEERERLDASTSRMPAVVNTVTSARGEQTSTTRSRTRSARVDAGAAPPALARRRPQCFTRASNASTVTPICEPRRRTSSRSVLGRSAAWPARRPCRAAAM